MFKIADTATFTRTVTVMVPADGGHVKQDFTATFRVVPVDKANGFDMRDEKGLRGFLVEAVERIDDIADAKGKSLPYSDTLRDQLLGLPYVRLALANAYFAAVSKVAEGN